MPKSVDLNKAIRILMAERGVKTQQNLAEMLGCDKNQVSRVMSKNKASLETLKKIADVFEIKVSELIAKGE